MKRITLCILVFTFAAASLYAQNEFSLRLQPRYTAPLAEENITGGFSGGGSLDWIFAQFSNYRFGVGVAATGGYSACASKGGEGLTLTEGALSPFFRWRISDRFSLRSGVSGGVYRSDYDGMSGANFRLGADIGAYVHVLPFLSVFAEAGYTFYNMNETAPVNAIQAGAGISLNIGELLRSRGRVTIEETKQERIFPVSFAWYEKNDVATVRVTNDEPNAISDVTLSFLLERYMNQPTVFAVIPRLRKGESAELPVTALFNESMLDLTDTASAGTRIDVGYRSLGLRRETQITVPQIIYNRNAMSWDDDRRAASFVSARDPAAVYFTKYVLSAVKQHPEIPGVSRNVLYACALFEALNLYGINYVVDPSSSFVELSENASALDSLNYPYQTLRFRGGDCDDLSILFCSLLQVVGIESAFITIPGHIYMAFDAGADENAVPDSLRNCLIKHEGRNWMPVEITVPRKGFLNAVKTGAGEWAGRGGSEDTGGGDTSGQRNIYPMSANWEIYQPVSVPGSGDSLPDVPSRGEIVERFAEASEALLQ